MLTRNAATNAAIALAIIATGGAWTCHMRRFIASEIQTGARQIKARLETAARNADDRLHSSLADIRQDIRAANRSRDRQLTEIREFLAELHRDRQNDTRD